MNKYDEKTIRAVQTESTIRIYQAYSHELANHVIKTASFRNNPFFKMTRMTWIKPSFLWMMYRSGWGMKEGKQQRILAIDITKEGFDWALNHSCSSHKPLNLSNEEWQKLKQETPVRVQWDPERDIHLNPLKYRTIQIGLSDVAVENYVNSWITDITDITQYTQEIRNLISSNKIEEAKILLPHEEIYLPNIYIDINNL
ncbi:hypothetical protein F909_01356 [Acinetobacter sp. ANC 3929]|uniref:DUF4291 domain-containing protein n=1 Tax=unclassified Acinetobacter TaxID=196816 RepID=UPI0002D12594|nr:MULTISPECIES: DUF4291 domain-containing protein [unclassified Acinetobacter]ENW81672.1 hypothetical protein F909_01356 [Acinetobacter sp. ANC 3929]MCH7353922.1 DUF4291 domain-containing protein [Acinetobacter sp. NIPH 2023]MCH7356834.1 DUF4291 domain-containing protein [Acinetobacter sp. NIPH 1958]MCH7361258.1 DUF4291 domain-containing protein [Acinetobacter sp. NIPH 2024]